MVKRLTVGECGEQIAKEYLQSLGYKFYKQNVRLGHDEVDLITYDPRERMLVFVEVKTRSRFDPAFPPQRNLTYYKRKKIRRAAGKWVVQQDYEGAYRVDVVFVVAGQVMQHYQGIGWDD